MILYVSTWPEIERFLNVSKTVIIPIGSNEQHGPTGLLGTDWLCPEIIAHAAEKRAAEQGEPILIAPTFNIGMAQHHLGFAGTISLRPSTFMAAIEDWVMSLARHGFERIYFLNGHGGNIATIEATFSEIYSRYSYRGEVCPFALKLTNWWDMAGIGKMCSVMFPTGHGSHATPSEIAITYAAYPDQVRDVVPEPKIAPTGPIREAADYRARFPDGRIGSDPTLASIEKGRQLIDAAAESLLKDIARFSAEALPPKAAT
ncbi:creatininase family protein [Asticcacaulis sp. SL142]|uniref:creatininase family protein n=1 Tax=Asticcacaulis sp. SL142 TaxID=2995155 RepID=UPI00226CB761|nr:creatininase family protein [Asticcacaulis sp. SL142]WAC47751.1 creatininase family protein [Asticcacaulis sp. SL142]